jgi:hypothetical protein
MISKRCSRLAQLMLACDCAVIAIRFHIAVPAVSVTCQLVLRTLETVTTAAVSAVRSCSTAVVVTVLGFVVRHILSIQRRPLSTATTTAASAILPKLITVLPLPVSSHCFSATATIYSLISVLLLARSYCCTYLLTSMYLYTTLLHFAHCTHCNTHTAGRCR